MLELGHVNAHVRRGGEARGGGGGERRSRSVVAAPGASHLAAGSGGGGRGSISIRRTAHLRGGGWDSVGAWVDRRRVRRGGGGRDTLGPTHGLPSLGERGRGVRVLQSAGLEQGDGGCHRQGADAVWRAEIIVPCCFAFCLLW